MIQMKGFHFKMYIIREGNRRRTVMWVVEVLNNDQEVIRVYSYFDSQKEAATFVAKNRELLCIN